MILTSHDVGREPFLRKRRPFPRAGTAEQNALAAALTGPWGIGSSSVTHAERAFAQAHNLPSSHGAVFVASGTQALVMALEALDIGYGDDVLVPALASTATATAVLDVNAIPVPIDVTHDSWTIDLELVEDHLATCYNAGRPLPKAIIAVHLYQRAADVRRLLSLCKHYGVWLIEDAADAPGARLDGEPLGTIGAIATFSFRSTKPLTCGEGGMVVTGVPHLEWRLRSLRDGGHAPAPSTISPTAPTSRATAHWRKCVDEASDIAVAALPFGPYRPTALTAALLAVQAERFPAEHVKRSAGLQDCAAALADVAGVTVPARCPELTHPVVGKLGFTLDPSHWPGLTTRRICDALSFLLGGYLVDPPHEPLAASPSGQLPTHYRPMAKRRHHVSPEYLAAIEPAVYDAPHAHELRQHGVVIDGAFLGERNPSELLTDALTWISRHTRHLAECRPS